MRCLHVWVAYRLSFGLLSHKERSVTRRNITNDLHLETLTTLADCLDQLMWAGHTAGHNYNIVRLCYCEMVYANAGLFDYGRAFEHGYMVFGSQQYRHKPSCSFSMWYKGKCVIMEELIHRGRRSQQPSHNFSIMVRLLDIRQCIHRIVIYRGATPFLVLLYCLGVENLSLLKYPSMINNDDTMILYYSFPCYTNILAWQCRFRIVFFRGNIASPCCTPYYTLHACDIHSHQYNH